MKILLFGDTTATHALTWKLFDSPMVDHLLCAPGNGGTGSVFAFDTDLDPHDESGAANFMFTEGIDLAIANQRAIVSGLWDTAHLLNKPVLGAGRAVAPLLTSRIALKAWLLRHKLPTLRGRILERADDAEKFAAGQQLPLQISSDDPDGPVVVCHERSELQAAVRRCMGLVQQTHGVLVEEALNAPLVVASWLSDGISRMLLPAVRVYPIHDQIANPAAGAHGASTQVWQRLEQVLAEQIVGPVERAFQVDTLPIRGWVSAECLIGQRGPILTRLAFTPPDQVAAVLLPRLGSDLAPLLYATATQTLGEAAPPVWQSPTGVAVLLYANVWPASSSGLVVAGLDNLAAPTLVFHHNTHNPQGLRYNPAARSSRLLPLFSAKPGEQRRITTTGPMILTVAAAAPELATARAAAYRTLEQLQVAGSTYRGDVARREL